LIPTPAAANCYLDTAALYDFNNRTVMTEDIPFFLDYAREVADRLTGPILELACGTGRVTVPLVEAGHSVVGLDLSAPMLEVLRGKREAWPQDQRDRLELVQEDMARFSLGREFPLIILPFRAFQVLIDPGDALSCLTCAREHLSEGGLFIFNVFHGGSGFERHWRFPETLQWERTDDSGLLIRKTASCDYDEARGVLLPRYAYEFGGNRCEESLALRMYRYDRLRGMIADCGLAVVEEYGWYDRRPVEMGEEYIFVCRKA
jgi:SAM-dependent methyltransferase